MKALVIGYGSIGSRHSRILKELGCQVAVVTARKVPVTPHFETIVEATLAFVPDYIVIATETARHMEAVAELSDIGFRGTLLVEKPLSHRVCDIGTTAFHGSFVAYNLRFHPIFQRLHELLITKKILSVQAYVGQYLPSWRPERDYRTVYSANKHAGGGVLRDLSHELDLLNWLLGGWLKLTALGGLFSNLEISSDDVFSILMSTARCPVVTVQMNYLDRIGQRRIVVNTEEQTIVADFIAGHILVNDVLEEFNIDRDHSYREMHRTLINGSRQDVCTLREGLEVLQMIAAAEKAVEEERWIVR